MSWGKGIALFFMSFVVFMSSLVYLSVREDFYLVTDNYYTDGVNYDSVQDKIENVKALKEKIAISQSVEEIQIFIPSNVKGGVLNFYRPSNGTLDFAVAIEDSNFEVNKSKIAKGNWMLKFSWTDGEKEYYFEESLFVL
ncbi:MAG: FixH family protein [Chitinophagales bacterium]